jgi:hypothetical protein
VAVNLFREVKRLAGTCRFLQFQRSGDIITMMYINRHGEMKLQSLKIEKIKLSAKDLAEIDSEVRAERADILKRIDLITDLIKVGYYRRKDGERQIRALRNRLAKLSNST